MHNRDIPMASVLPAQRPNREEHEGDARTTAEQACGECRRRKSKVSLNVCK